MLSKLLWVGLGGFTGAVLRYAVSGWVQQWTKSVTFPYGTLAVNLLGCFVIGLLTQLLETRNMFSVDARLFVFMGLLGAFTTFSTFENEALNLLRDGEVGPALTDVTFQVVLGLGMVWLGRIVTGLIWR